MLYQRLATVLLVVLAAGSLPVRAEAQATADSYFEFMLARRLEAEGNNQGALAALQRAAAADPKSAEVRAEIASFHLRRNQRSEAEKAARAALALDEDNTEANRALGLTLAAAVDAATERTPSAQTQTNLRDAIKHLERASEDVVPPDANLQFRLGGLYLRTGDTDKAVQAYSKVVAQNPDNPQALTALASAYAAGKQLDRAITTLADWVDDEPRVAGALAQYLDQAGRYSDAVAVYTRALAVTPGNVRLKVQRITAALNARDFSRAATYAAEARKQHPDDLRFPRMQARALFDGGDRSGAISVMEATAKAYPTDVATQFGLADMYADAGRGPEAEKLLRQIISADPGNASALNYLGYMLAVRGEQLDEAIRLVRRALDTDPGNGAYLDSLGWAYFRKGDLDEAEKYLAAAAERLPDNSDVQDHLGDLYARRGRLDQAITAWTRALDGDGQDVEKSTIEKKIADARRKLAR